MRSGQAELGERLSALPRVTVVAGLLVVCVYLVGRLARFVAANSVTLLYGDQWAYVAPLIDGRGPLQIFWWQYGVHRLGVGGLITWLLANGSGWDGRAEAWAVLGFTVLNALLALWLVIRTTGRLSMLHAVVPLLVLNLFQYEVLVVIPNTALSAVPVTCLLLGGHALLMSRPVLRYGCLLACDLAAIPTGFGFVLGLVVPLLLAFELRTEPRHRRLIGVSVAVALTAAGAFLIGYDFETGTGAAYCGQARPGLPVGFWLALWNGTFQLSYGGPSGWLVPAMVLLAGAAALRSAWKGDRRALSLLLLLAFSGAFSLAVTAGRSCLGEDAATSPRYSPLLVPAFVAVYGLLAHAAASRTSQQVAILYVLAITFWSAGNSAYLTQDVLPHSVMLRAWQSCYLQSEDANHCDAQTGLSLQPGAPTSPGLDRALAFLKANRLNLYHPAL
jgi:hypothetical protein